ncbi:MAG: hypothetical protein ACTH02_09505 [Corynebacterium sp.]
MAATDAFRRLIPEGGDPADLPYDLGRYSLTDTGLINVTSRTDAEAMRTAYNAACTDAGITPGPLVVYRQDLRNIEAHANVAGRTWEYMGGRRRGVTAIMQRIIPADTTYDAWVTGFARQSEGFTLSESNALIIVPQTGIWSYNWVGSYGGSDASTARAKFQILTGAGTLIGATTVPARQASISGFWPLTEGEGIKIRSSHGAPGSVTLDGTLQLQLLGGAPDW